MRLLELLTRTMFQVFTFPLGTMKNGVYPNGAGSGFMLLHNEKRIFVTADHVCHPGDYKPNVNFTFNSLCLYALSFHGGG